VFDDAMDYNIEDWYADAAGAFQNQEIRNRGLRVTSRPFQAKTRGKEWMIGIAYYWLSRDMVVIPDIPEFEPLKEQLRKWKRDSDGKPKKGNDHCCDAFICFISKWDPRYYDDGETKSPPTSIERQGSANNWDSFKTVSKAWMPDSWKDNETLRKEPWEK
jgi:hypothetical protein